MHVNSGTAGGNPGDSKTVSVTAYFDDFSMVTDATPEPATATLLVLGSLALLRRNRDRSKRFGL